MEQISYLKRNLIRHPQSKTLDIFKLLYQNAFFVGHIVDNKRNVYNYLTKEIDLLRDKDYSSDELYEYIGPNALRLNLFSFIDDYDFIFDLFIKTSEFHGPGNLKEIIDLLEVNDEEKKELDELYEKHVINKMIPVHSEKYRELYHPHYRVIKNSFLPLDLKVRKLQRFVNSIKEENSIKIIALEGKCGSGKSVITKELKDITIIEIDDHFDSPNNEKFNVDAIANILSDLKIGSVIKEKCYDCHTKTYYYKEKEVKNVIIVEGVYSYHPELIKYYDYLGYVVVEKEEQEKRIKERNNALDYFEKWIPREEEYYQSNDFILKADILI